MAIQGTDLCNSLNWAPKGKKKGFTKGKILRAVLILALHETEGRWPGQLGLVRPIM